MSNLGGYQTLTTWSKKLGGPYHLLFLVATGGYVVIRTGEGIVKKLLKSIKPFSQKDVLSPAKEFVVLSQGKSNEGLIFNVGDKFRVLNVDQDSVLIEKVGDSNNPYFVSAEFLTSISNFNP